MEASEIIEMIQSFYGDRSRTKQETLDGLNEIGAEVEGMIDCLDSEIEKEEG